MFLMMVPLMGTVSLKENIQHCKSNCAFKEGLENHSSNASNALELGPVAFDPTTAVCAITFIVHVILPQPTAFPITQARSD